mgnify:CR=1 FL=1
MTTISRSVALLSAIALFGASAWASTRDQSPISADRTVSAYRSIDLCPPSACTIVMKTEKGGPPSRIVKLEQ